MELRGWQQCQRKPSPCTGTLSLLPPSWDTVSTIYSQVVKLVSKFPCHKRLVLCFAYKGTTVKLDLGDVKAAGVVCVLGLGVCLGTLFIYRLYDRYVRPFLDSEWSDSEDLSCSDCSLLQDSSDSGVDGAVCTTSQKDEPSVLYSAPYGVAFAGKGTSPRQHRQTTVDGVRLRRGGTRQRPRRRHCVERDSKPDTGPYLNPPLHEANFRDSFYSTAESGFETLPECNEEEEEEDGEDRGIFSNPLRAIYSALSVKQKDGRHPSSSSGDRTNSSPSGTRTVVDMSMQDHEQSCDHALAGRHSQNGLLSVKSSPVHKEGRLSDSRPLSPRKGNSLPHSVDFDYDPSLDASESIQSFNSTGEEWSWEEGEKDVSANSPPHTAMTDQQFRQSLIQRIQEWSSFAEEHRDSWSPTPGSMSPPEPRHIRRSRSLDRHLGEPVFMPDMDMSPSEPIQVEDSTIRNLECLQTEFHDIQDEFESITSKLRDLIKRSSVDDSQLQSSAAGSPSHTPNHLHHPPHGNPRPHPPFRHTRTRWEFMPSESRSNSRRSSRASSVEFSWDCGEVGLAKETGDCAGMEREQAELSDRVMGPEGDCAKVTEEGLCPYDGSASNRLSSVGEPVSIVEYAEQEWKGGTTKATTIKQGYYAVPELFHCQRLRQIRGDNYCALRSTLFQVLVGGHKVTRHWPGPISIVDRIRALHSGGSSGLEHWTFAGRVVWEREGKLAKLTRCILSLYATIDEVSALRSPEERLARTLSLLNDSERFDVELMEGLKLMMYLYACDLHHDMTDGADVPVFAFLLFARDTSSDIVSFVQNHLNCVGDSAGLDQVEMCLLGHCLSVRLRVARLDHYGQQEFDCVFPDEAPDTWPTVCLLAEDDRHYNVPVA